MATSSPPAQFKSRELCSFWIERLGYENNLNRAKFSSVMMDAYLAIYSEIYMHAVEYPSHEFSLTPRHREDLPKFLPNIISPRLHKMKAAIEKLASTPNSNYRADMILLDMLDFARTCFLQGMAVLQQEGFKTEVRRNHYPLVVSHPLNPYNGWLFFHGEWCSTPPPHTLFLS